jgi:hypothetical protein
MRGVDSHTFLLVNSQKMHVHTYNMESVYIKYNSFSWIV